MKVENGLTTALTVIDDKTKSVIDTQLLCHFSRNDKQVTQKVVVLIGAASMRDRFSRNNQNVCWRLRIDILDDDTLLVLVEKIGWDFTRVIFPKIVSSI